MKKIHCNGCGMEEDLDAPKHKIGEVKLLVSLDSREWAGNKEYHADLCPTCVSQALHNYFGIEASGNLDVPAFIEPRRLRTVG
jgi:D-hexose-6-phosphate mutarotase